MPSANFNILVLAFSSVGVLSFRMIRSELTECPGDAASQLTECETKIKELSQMNFDPEQCGILRTLQSCVEDLVDACRETNNTEFIDALGSGDDTGGQMSELCMDFQVTL